MRHHEVGKQREYDQHQEAREHRVDVEYALARLAHNFPAYKPERGFDVVIQKIQERVSDKARTIDVDAQGFVEPSRSW